MTRTIDWLLEKPENFETLLGMCLLFDKNSDYYKLSGFVTAALLDHDDPDKQISILAIDTRHLSGWITFKYSREDLRKMFSHCIEFVGKTPEESFTLV